MQPRNMHLCMLLGRFWHMLSPDTTWVPFSKFIYLFIGFLGSAVVKNPPATVGDTRDIGSIPGSGRSPGEGNSSPLQYFCLENPMDRGAWRATVHGIAKSQTRLNNQDRQTSRVGWRSSQLPDGSKASVLAICGWVTDCHKTSHCLTLSEDQGSGSCLVL